MNNHTAVRFWLAIHSLSVSNLPLIWNASNCAQIWFALSLQYVRFFSREPNAPSTFVRYRFPIQVRAMNIMFENFLSSRLPRHLERISSVFNKKVSDLSVPRI